MELRLLELRRKTQLTQEEVANHLQISRQAYALYESNQRHMSYDSLHMLAELFSVSIDYLLGRNKKNLEYVSDDELTLLRRFRELDERGHNSVQANLEFEYTQISQQKGRIAK